MMNAYTSGLAITERSMIGHQVTKYMFSSCCMLNLDFAETSLQHLQRIEAGAEIGETYNLTLIRHDE